MEDTVLYRDPTEVFSPLESDKVSNVSSLSAFLATLNQSGSGNTKIRRFLDETGSLDVNVGDNNSCRLSDISSISYTNVTQDDNESLGCETNASLDNIIDSASSCRSDEESPYELDHDDADYGLDSSGYFGNQDLFPERPTKVDKSSMTNLVPSDDDIKNFMSITDLHDRNSGFSAEIKRDAIKPRKSVDDSPGAEIKEASISPKAEKPLNKNVDDTSNVDICMRSPSFLHASSDDESSSELKEIFVNKDFSNKIELKLNGMIGTKSAISNCKGSKVMLEFYCSKNVDKERTNKLSELRDELKVNKNISRNTCSEFDMLENNLGYKDLIDLSRPQKESEVTVDMSLAKPVVITKSHDETKKVRIPSRIRPSPGLAKRIEESRAESTMQDSQPSAKFAPTSTTDGFPTNDKRLLDLAKNDESNSQSADSSEPKTEEKKSCSAKALDFCNEDIESSLNEIRSILYGSRIGLAKSSSHATNLNQSINSHATTKMQTSSNNLIDSSIQLTDKDLCINNIKHSSSCEVLKDLSEGKIFTNEEEFAKTKDNPSNGQPAKAEMSVIDELLEELRMNEPNNVEDQDVPQINSPSVEMKSDFKYKLVDNHPERTYVVNLSVPYTLEKKTFSLSPEATDCDSIDASSIISEEGKTSPSAMPVVEDGLSSEDEGRDGLNEFPRGGKARKSYTNSIRAEHIPRVLKHEDRFFQTSSSGSASNLSISSSHSKQNGLPVQMKLSEKQGPKKDIKPKVKENSTEPLPVHLDNIKVQVDVKVKSERPETERNPDGQDIIEMKKMSEIALFQSSTKSSIQKFQTGANSLRIGEEDDKTLQKADQDIGRNDSYEVRQHPKLNHPTRDLVQETSEEGLNKLNKGVPLQDLKPTQDDKTSEKKLSDAAGAAKTPNDDKTRAKNYDSERESFLIEGVLFRAQYLGSTQLVSEGQPSKATRLMQAQEAINRIKDPTLKGNPRPSTLVDLFVSVEKIMVLNTDLQEIMMDHALRTISYIADIGDVLVVMARRGPMNNGNSPGVGEPAGQDQATLTSTVGHNQAKICCHVFESDEAQLIAQSISQAFQVAYIEFLKANGINDPDLIKEMDYQDVLSQQEIFGEELFLFSNRDMQKEVLVPKSKGEPLGMVIVESGWGSMVPTVVLANMAPGGAAARCGQLNIGDQIISVNGISLVGLPLSTCQAHLKALRNEILARFMVVSCTPVVEVLVKRPDIKYQLGFSVQNGVICSLLRGGIAERGGVRVGHRIIEINGNSVVAVPHDKIVSMLASSVGEIHMKTMQTSIYRLLTGQDTPHYI